MTEQEKITIFDALIKLFLCSDSSMDGPDGNHLLTLAIRQLLNSLLLAQRDKHLECERYERVPKRNGQRNGFKARTIRTSTGQITLYVPQVRNSQTPFIPIIPGFERGSRMDRALNLAIAEMYLQGVSTRKVAKVMNEICGGNGVSVTYVSQFSIFPSEASLLRIVTAKAMDLSDEWEGISGKSYISPEKLQLVAEALQAGSSQPQHPAASPQPQTHFAPMTGILQKKLALPFAV